MKCFLTPFLLCHEDLHDHLCRTHQPLDLQTHRLLPHGHVHLCHPGYIHHPGCHSLLLHHHHHSRVENPDCTLKIQISLNLSVPWKLTRVFSLTCDISLTSLSVLTLLPIALRRRGAVVGRWVVRPTSMWRGLLLASTPPVSTTLSSTAPVCSRLPPTATITPALLLLLSIAR